MFTIDNIIYQTGSNGPVFLIFLSMIILYNKTKYLTVFLMGSFMNAIINYILKGLIAQPRPNDTKIEIEKRYSKILNFERYGMPSGHVQIAFFTLVFTYLATQDIRVLVGYFILSLVVIYQRVHYGYHFISQAIVGAFIGSVIAWLFFQYGLKVHKGKLKYKKDDYYFGPGSV